MACSASQCRHLLRFVGPQALTRRLLLHVKPALSSVHLTCNKHSSSTDPTMDGRKQNDLMTKENKDFLQKTHDVMIKEALTRGTDRAIKVWDFKTPQQILDGMDITINEEGTSHEKLLEIFKQTAHNSVQSAHPRYFNQLYSGRDVAGLAAVWLIESLNANVHTYETGPVFTVTEQYVMEQVCQKLGFTEGEGIFNPGGSMCNFIGIHLARYRYNNAVKQEGIWNSPKMALITTSDAHYSVSKAAHFMGFGTDSVVHVETDNRNRMCPQDLERKIQQLLEKGTVPLIVIATCGTTVTGAYDPLDELADVCEKHGVWLHVDACWGGGVIFSDNHKHLMKGVDRSDSVSISFHKLMGANIQCSALMVKHKGMLRACNTTEASYLFQTDKDYYEPLYDIGMNTIQCGRKADGYKFWALWKARGHSGMQQHVDQAMDKAKYFTEKIKSLDGFKPIYPEFQYLNISFWFIPPSLRWQKESPEFWEKVSKVAPQIKSRMVTDGTIAIGYQPLPSKGFVNFFRIIIENPLATYEDLDFVLSEIQRLGADL